MTKVIFFGSSEYSVIILDKLLTLPDFQVPLVVTKTDKPVGRHQQITPNHVAQYCLDHQLSLLQIDTFDKNCKLKIKNSQAQLGLCVAFGPPFFDDELINMFPHKIVNIHPSPLPKYRGATPGPWQIINGEINSAVTFFQIDNLPDHGPIITQIPFEISPTDTSDSFYRHAFSLAAANLEFTLNSYLSNSIILIPQDHSQKSYYPKLNKDLAQINWSWDIFKIERFIRAMQSWPTAWTGINDKNGKKFKMKVISANIISNNLEFKKVHIEGKNPTLWLEIKNYYTIIK